MDDGAFTDLQELERRVHHLANDARDLASEAGHVQQRLARVLADERKERIPRRPGRLGRAWRHVRRHRAHRRL